MPWALIAIVVGTGLWMVFDYRERAGEPPTRAANATDDDDGTTASPPESTPTESPTASPKPTKVAPVTEPPRKRDKPIRLITEGVTVQVLNGTSDPEAGAAMEAELTELGFQVVAVEATSQPYKETTVFWSFPDATRAAEALAAKRDWVADQKPANLADTVSLHVVVGQDFL